MLFPSAAPSPLRELTVLMQAILMRSLYAAQMGPRSVILRMRAEDRTLPLYR